MDFLGIIHGLSRLVMDYPWIIHEYAMDYEENLHALSMDNPGIFHG